MTEGKGPTPHTAAADKHMTVDHQGSRRNEPEAHRRCTCVQGQPRTYLSTGEHDRKSAFFSRLNSGLSAPRPCAQRASEKRSSVGGEIADVERDLEKGGGRRTTQVIHGRVVTTRLRLSTCDSQTTVSKSTWLEFSVAGSPFVRP